MSDPRPLDRIRAWAEGAADPDAAAAANAAFARDPSLAQDARAYLEVHRLTEPLAGTPEPSQLAYEDLDLGGADIAETPREIRTWRTVAACAAALVVVLGVTFFLRAGPGTTSPEGLATVRLAHVPLAQAPERLPATLEDGYEPVRDGAIAWLADPVEAKAVAAATGRRLLEYVHHRQCPMCREMEGKTLKDKTVLARLDGFVPVRIDVESLPQAQASRMFTSGWPHFAVLDAKGATIGALSGMRGPAEFGEGLARWAPVADASTPTWAEAQAKARERKAQARARDDLLAVAAQAPTEPAAARRRLEQTVADLRGTPQGRDVAKVLAAWPEGAKFPELLEDGR